MSRHLNSHRGSRRNRKIASLIDRRRLLGLAAGFGAGLLGPMGGLHAQGRWYERAFNNGVATPQRPNHQRRRQVAKLSEDETPLASQDMLERLDAAIQRYEEIVEDGGWPVAKTLRFLREGNRHTSLPTVRAQLLRMGDLDARRGAWPGDAEYFGPELTAALKRFQARHGLRVTGWIDRSTRFHLRFTAKQRLAQLKLNRRRIKALIAQTKHKRYVFVNVPAYQLEAVARGKAEQRHVVIVGRADRETPDITATIRNINFYPYWHVPQSIAKRDLIPRARKDPSFLTEQHFRVSRGGRALDPDEVDWEKADNLGLSFRQNPGPWNALGLVRIDMPNKDIIYLHDTPLKKLFRDPHRAYSAGCIRVHDVMSLVSWIGAGVDKLEDEAAIEEIVEDIDPDDLVERRPSRLNVKLPRPVPVHLAYVTAWVDEDDGIAFRADIYGRDKVRKSRRRLAVQKKPSADALSP